MFDFLRKPTFIGQYTRWDSFGPSKRKTNFISTLVHRALKICSKNKLQQELDYIKSILRDNRYPEISKEIAQFQEQPKERHQNFSVYLSLACIGSVSHKFKKQTNSAIKECYSVCPTAHHILNQENSICNLQIPCAHHSTKYGCISIRVPL